MNANEIYTNDFMLQILNGSHKYWTIFNFLIII